VTHSPERPGGAQGGKGDGEDTSNHAPLDNSPSVSGKKTVPAITRPQKRKLNEWARGDGDCVSI